MLFWTEGGNGRVPTLVFDAKRIQPGETVVIEESPGEDFRPLEVSERSGGREFVLVEVSADGENQLLVEVPFHVCDGMPLPFPFVKDAVRVRAKNVSSAPADFLMYLFGRVRAPGEGVQT